MTTNTRSEEFGSMGIWSGAIRAAGDSEGPAAARELEELGYGTLWIPGGMDSGVLDSVDQFLDGTTSLKIGTGVLNIWKHEPADVAKWWQGQSLERRARIVLGLGISHAPLVGEAYNKPYSHMVAFLDALEAAGFPLAQAACLGAIGPRTLKLAASRTLGSHPYLVSLKQIARSREAMGPDALLAPEVGVVLEADPAKARAIARNMVGMYTGFPNYTGSWMADGFTQADIDNLSDGLIDSLIAWGDLDAIAGRIAQVRAAGADQVSLQVITAEGFGATCRDHQPAWRELAKLI